MVKINASIVRYAWILGAKSRGYNFGFIPKLRFPDEVKTWSSQCDNVGVINRPSLKVTTFLPFDYDYLSKAPGTGVNFGANVISLEKSISGTGVFEPGSLLTSFRNLNSILINYSDHYQLTSPQTAQQLRMVLETNFFSKVYSFITICVGEDKDAFIKGFKANDRTAFDFVGEQIFQIFRGAEIQPDEISRILVAYKPRFLMRENEISEMLRNKYKNPADYENYHIGEMGWTILGNIAKAVDYAALQNMVALQYSGIIEDPRSKDAPVQRFIGENNKIDYPLYNGGLIEIDGADPTPAAAIVNKIVPKRKF